MTIQIKVQGNLGQNFKLSSVTNKSGEAGLVLNFSIASQSFRRKTDGQGYEPVGDTEWIECDYWNRNAGHLHHLLQKGMPIVAFGEERIETYHNRDGLEIRVRKLRVDELYIVPSKRIESIVLRSSTATDNAVTSSNVVVNDLTDDEIPY